MVKVLTKVADLPDFVNELVNQREQARSNKNFSLADNLRAQIEDMGYVVNDKEGGVEVFQKGDRDKKAAQSYLVLFGSGEIAPSSVVIYRELFLSLEKKDLHISLITSPAGFQPNVEHVYSEIRDYLLASLPDFNLTIDIVFANHREDADDEEIVEAVNHADIIFLGPGSPTYAVKTLQSTKLYDKILEKVKQGSSLILASAATLAFSKYCIPVYEIYKVGEDLHWVDGLNIYKDLWKECSIIPHFNNREGGVDLDTSYCYIGEGRAKEMLEHKEGREFVGIDEHTALIIDLENHSESVKGKGAVHQIDA